MDCGSNHYWENLLSLYIYGIQDNPDDPTNSEQGY
jgi:hypothetical protein